MKNYRLEQFLNDPHADMGTGLMVTRGFGYCFTLKQPHRWGKTEDGSPILPFGGIGGKLEPGESPDASLHREAVEEVGSDVDIASNCNEVILMDANAIEVITLSTDLPDQPLPRIIFRSPQAEAGRKPFTNVLIYAGRFSSSGIRPIDDPALIELETELLLRLAEQPMSVKEFQQAGGRITTRIELPENGFLKPIGTSIAIARCIKQGVINSTTLM